VRPAGFPRHILRFRNQPWALRVGVGQLSAREWQLHMGALRPLPGNLPQPLALRYHGHQFRHYNPHLGDGRGFLHAQLRDPIDGRLLDLGTKGSGTTPWSRGGDGRLTLKGGVREALAAEMLEALGVDTCKILSLFETGESLIRHDEPSPTRACVMVRLSHGHIRFGTFQRLFYQRDSGLMEDLVRHALRIHYPQRLQSDDSAGDDPAVALLGAVTERVAATCAGWMAAGFVHGVLNTDNMNISGESFDYGPYRFLPTCDPAFVAAYFDHQGLYCYGRQPEAVRWNLDRLADALSLIAPREALAAAAEGFGAAFSRHFDAAILTRLGLRSRNLEDDDGLTTALFRFLERSRVGFDAFFFDWYGGQKKGPRRYQGREWDALHELMAVYEAAHPDKLSLPYFSRAEPCAMLIDEIEAIWAPIASGDDWAAFEDKIRAVRELAVVYGRAPQMPGDVRCPLLERAALGK